MSLKDMMDLVYGLLNKYAVSQSGKAAICSSEQQQWYYCFRNENFPLYLLIWTGETLRGSQPNASINRMADQTFDVIVTRNRGLELNRAQTLVYGAGNAPPLYLLTEEARDLVRCITSAPGAGQMQEWPIQYHGAEILSLPGFIMDGYRLKFSLMNFLPATSQAYIDAVNQGA